MRGGGRGPAAVSLRPRAALVALAALLALVLAIAATTGGGDPEPGSPRFAPAPPDAPLERRLDALDRAVRDPAGR